MLVFNCQNGLVAFWVQRADRTRRVKLICINDGQRFVLRLGIGQTVIDEIASIATKARSLRGAIQQVFLLPINF